MNGACKTGALRLVRKIEAGDSDPGYNGNANAYA